MGGLAAGRIGEGEIVGMRRRGGRAVVVRQTDRLAGGFASCTATCLE